MGNLPEVVKVAIEEEIISIAFLNLCAFLYATRIALAHRDNWTFSQPQSIFAFSKNSTARQFAILLGSG